MEYLKKQIEETMKHYGVYQFKKARKMLLSQGYYTRHSSHGSKLRGKGDLYMLYNGGIIKVATNCNPHRIKVLIKNFHKYKNGEIDKIIWENYCKNGYMTRCGLYRSVKKERMQKIAESHTKYNYYKGKAGHDLRVKFRN